MNHNEHKQDNHEIETDERWPSPPWGLAASPRFKRVGRLASSAAARRPFTCTPGWGRLRSFAQHERRVAGCAPRGSGARRRIVRIAHGGGVDRDPDLGEPLSRLPGFSARRTPGAYAYRAV
jgi:hypothetical protein